MTKVFQCVDYGWLRALMQRRATGGTLPDVLRSSNETFLCSMSTTRPSVALPSPKMEPHNARA